MKCPEDAAILKSFIERDHVYDFLVGLNPKFDQVKIQILGKEDTPSLEDTISLIRAEKSRRSVMLEPQTMDGLPWQQKPIRRGGKLICQNIRVSRSKTKTISGAPIARSRGTQERSVGS